MFIVIQFVGGKSKMAKTRNHPKRVKQCVFCNYWIGDADLKFVSSTVGYEYEYYAQGKCAKKSMNAKAYQSCNFFAPSIDASKLL